ncbi:MAG: iron reductase, partial [Ferrovibrionaceae bacterium]
PNGVPLGQLLGAMSDLEFAITARETLKRTLARWVVLHIAASIVMYALLVLHIWSGIYYGLRWLG